MNLVREKVIHKKYGTGEITKLDNDHVYVKFQSVDQEKIFKYPSCFDVDGYLTLENQDIKTTKTSTTRNQANKNKNKNNKKQWNQSYKTMDVFYEKYKDALQGEISYLRKNGGKKQSLFDGKLIEFKKGKYIYSFESDDELSYPEGTPITIWHRQEKEEGSIVGCEEFTIIIETKAKLGKDIPSIDISAEPWRLLNSLIERLTIMESEPSQIVKSLICEGTNSIDQSDTEISRGQDTAVKMSFEQPITFVWGPPGTGKTQTLAKIALKHIENEEKVLMLSYSNVSVDGAVKRVAKLAGDTIKPGIFVRYGYPKDKELLNHEYLTSYNLSIHRHPSLLRKRQELLDRRKYISRTSSEYATIEEELKSIRLRLMTEEKECVKDARFVATTVSKAVVDPVIFDSKFDVVIFDEASMAYIPQIIFSASLAEKHFVCMGDFRQLPPIVQSNKNSVLNTDIFQYCGITKAVNEHKKHEWLCLLDTQYRMHPKIAEFVSHRMYNDLLKSAGLIKDKISDITKQEPLCDQAMVLADLSGLLTTCTKVSDNSRVNILSAFLSFYLALNIEKKYKIGIITPYHAQSRLLHAMIRDTASIHPEVKTISSATVHQFQGSEKDVIIYDAVDCYRMKAPGILLTSMQNDYANRLFNVALTRSRGKFIGLANVDYMKNKKLSQNLIFKKMIDKEIRESNDITGTYFEEGYNKELGNTMKFYKEKEGEWEFINDIITSKREIRIDIPDKPKTSLFITKLVKALKEAKQRGIKVCIRAENRKSLPRELMSLAIENTFVSNPLAIIDKKIVWYGIPSTQAGFKEERVKYRPIIRFKGANTASAIYGFMEMNKTIDESNAETDSEEEETDENTFAAYIRLHKKCPKCGKPMQLKKSPKGKFFISCIGYPRCKTTEFVKAEFVEEYFNRNGGTGQKCVRCKYSLTAEKSRYGGGLYIHCCGYPVHSYRLDEI